MPVQKQIEIPTRRSAIEEHRAQGGRIAAVFPIHYPRALFRAFGLLPVEVWGPPAVDPGPGAVHIQPYICSIIRNGLSLLLTGGLDIADVVVVPHACDSLQGLGSILLDFLHPRSKVVTLYVPRGSRQSDLEFLAAEIRATYLELAGHLDHIPSVEQLLTAIHQDEEADARLAQLHQERCHLGLSNSAFYRLIRSREFVPAEAFTRIAQQALVGANKQARSPAIPILLSGIVPEPLTLFEAITELGGEVVGDDLAACGRRLYPPGRADEPFVRMAERILGAPPDPMRGCPIAERIRYLLDLADRTDARGLVFYEVKFCEPELFDLPYLRQELQRSGLPSLVIETDLNDPLSQQVVTRLGAFLEMLT